MLKDRGGFEHNRQCLRVVDFLERRYPGFPGLNLTFELREGILKHKTDYDHPAIPEDLKNNLGPSLECQVVNFADEIAYNCHDIDDGLSSGVIDFESVSDTRICSELLAALNPEFPDIEKSVLRRILVRNLIDELVTDLVNTSRSRLAEYEGISSLKLREMKIDCLSFSSEMKDLNSELKIFLAENMYRHPRMVENARRAKEIIRTLFKKYSRDSELVPYHFRMRLNQEPFDLIVADYIAGMTDRFATTEFEKNN